MGLLTFLILPIISGYVFALTWQGSRYHVARMQGYALYFKSAYYGLILSVISALCLMILVSNEAVILAETSETVCFLYPFLCNVDFQSVSFLIIVCLVGILGGYLLNALGYLLGWLISVLVNACCDVETFNLNAWFLYQRTIKDNDFERLIFRAIKRVMPLYLTLRNNKVYVGYVIRTIDPANERKEIRILPLLSGYRDKDNCRVYFTTKYDKIYRSIKEQQEGNLPEDDVSHLAYGDFEIVIPVSEIITSSLFDLSAYNRFSPADVENPNEGIIIGEDLKKEVGTTVLA